jgi:cytochrome b involved in lipid metabolism
MKKVFELNSPDINQIIIDKNRYFLKIRNTDDLGLISSTFKTIISNNIQQEVTVGTEKNNYINSTNKAYFQNITAGKESSWVKIKNHKYGWYAIQFWNLYKLDNSSFRSWNCRVTDTRYNSDLIIEHEKQDFRFIVKDEIEFPISKYLKYIKGSFKNIEVRKKEKDVKKFVSDLTWMGIFGEWANLGWEEISLKKGYDNFAYNGSLSTGRHIEIKLEKTSEEDNPLFTIWMVKGQLGTHIKKDAMMKIVEGLMLAGLLKAKKVENVEEDC